MFVAFGIGATPIHAAPGDLDPTFGIRGKVEDSREIHLAGGGKDLAVDSDGKILVASGTAVSRVTADGRWDTAFGEAGRVALPDGFVATSIALQPDRKLVLGGGYEGDFAVLRLLPEGQPDTSFSGDGIAIGRLAERVAPSANAVAIQPDGRIIAAGNADLAAGFMLARFTSDGTLDTSFSDDGITTTRINRASALWDIALQPDGKVLAAGYSNYASAAYEVAIARFRADGVLDESFGDGGTVVTRLPDQDSYSTARSVAIQTDGRIVAAASRYPAAAHLIRYLPDGALDTTFSEDGIQTDPHNPTDIVDVELQSDGRLVVIGSSEVLSIARYQTDGTLDTTFGGGDGIVRTPFWDARQAAPAALAIQPDGRIVALGVVSTGGGRPPFSLPTHRYLVLARYQIADGPADADIDGLRDFEDACTELYFEGSPGCPSRERSVTIRRLKRKLGGTITSPRAECARHRRVILYRRNKGHRKRIGKVETNFAEDFRLRQRRWVRGRYWARVPEEIEPLVGVCPATRSDAIRVRPRPAGRARG